MNEPLRVTFLFKDEAQFKNFLESAQVETFTYNLKKKEYTVDLSQDISTSISAKSPASMQETSSNPPNQIMQAGTMSSSDFL